jgi:predicted AlkP superfamily pyrophosphatase or phosphodiesterase
MNVGLRHWTGGVALACSSLAAPAPAVAQAGSGSGQPAALVVLLVVDQMIPDYFDRFGAQLTGGLGRLRRDGAFFTHGMQDHAITQTAPGHSTLLSGRPPSSTGIITNDDGVGDARYPLIDAPGESGASPRNFNGTALYDWMLARDSGTRLLAVSRKDRGAILPVGRARGDVYWFAGGRFTTSRYYADTLPAWVRAFNDRHGVERLAGKRWDLLLPPADYPEPDSMPWERRGRDIGFPHLLPAAAAIDTGVLLYPWMDSLTLDLALEGVRQTEVGRRAHPDLLVVSLSTTDKVGHEWGPDSREMHDHILRLDRWLGRFLDSLGTMVPARRTFFVLAADHGTQAVPEYNREVRHRPGGRQWLGSYVTEGERRFDARYRRRFGFRFEYGLVLADVDALRALGVAVDSLADAWAADARRRPGVARVYTPKSLATAPTSDRFAARWRRAIPPGTGWLLAAVPSEGVIWSKTGVANHGTALDADVRVPIIFAGPGIRPGRYERPVPTEDIGPTLAALIGVRPTEPVAGHPIPEVVGR